MPEESGSCCAGSGAPRPNRWAGPTKNWPRLDFTITALIPTIEAHITTPLNHRQPTDVFTTPDLVALTAGMHIGLGSRSMLTLGATAPVTGPRPWNVEAVAQFNFRF